ncbi:MAG: hypothetical protein GYB65_04280 [Chloroflexi bacterium]|nr:hypothetical protein [Chloroflexota bacterium]
MRRQVLWTGMLLLILLAGALAPVSAQDGDGLSDVELAMLEEVRAALDGYLASETYTATLTQTLNQTMTINFQGQTITLTQAVIGTGGTQFQRAPENVYDNQQTVITQVIEQTLTGLGQNNTGSTSLEVELRVVDDAIYMRMTDPTDQLGVLPEGWQNITQDASAFPGLDLINVDEMMGFSTAMSRNTDSGAILAAVTAVDDLGEDTAGNVPVQRYRLTLSVAEAVDALGMDNIENMFSAADMPFDVEGLLAAMYDGENTSFNIDVAISTQDQTLVEFTQLMVTDMEIGPELILDPALAGATMTLVQDYEVTYTIDYAAPVEILVPDLSADTAAPEDESAAN